MSEVCKDFTDRLIAFGEMAPAAEVTHHGHMIGALSHYQHLSKGKKELTNQKAAAEGLVVNLRGCTARYVVVILLAWSFNLSLALQGAPKSRPDQVVRFEFGESS